MNNPEVKIIEEKVKKLVLEQIKSWATEACNIPTDDNINKLFNVVEYLKKILKKDDDITIASQLSQPLIHMRDGWYGDSIMTTSATIKTEK